MERERKRAKGRELERLIGAWIGHNPEKERVKKKGKVKSDGAVEIERGRDTEREKERKRERAY